ncbi:Pimeloyl-ACP methyl ester carboxylesterase [Micromonospora phaseoli]|uniref:Pimeloyl-ACP methyl ester carboxylesterase n=1 Tax=Micromonospora phaseoli TaxID=1144548 RepID=A0A1H7DTU5_9ACTN|nr:alpha/beta hydrolase [Micromonospora phaseoli]PZV99187.1 pimeloyl-ACP methyl ester carboxylesterase [Micromonospora phaseoli]GIJ80017.1 dihydrolipoamide acetyltransferase [Micromonospora phaseoli]SEK04814.1 Pimeloyl-ACP methyl ester carboxylesterase [Micromonospora phaseoli]
MWAYRSVEMGWGRLAYRTVEGGPDTAGEPPMVLLHGGGGDGTTWDALAPTLAQRRTVHLPDLRGMGRSDRVGPYSLAVLRDDLLALLDRWELDRVVLVGHSLGGVAALLATQAAPQRVAALVLEECPPPVPLGFTIPTGLPDSAPYYDREIRPSVLAELNAPDPARWETLATIPVPTLVLAGGPTSHLPQEAMARMADRIPAGRLVTIPTGHHIHPNASAAFVTAVESFLTDSPA